MCRRRGSQVLREVVVYIKIERLRGIVQRRLLVVAPESLAPEILATNLGDEIKANPTVLADPDNDVFICYEVKEQPLRRVAAAIVDPRYHAVEVASRLHARMDVPWTPL